PLDIALAGEPHGSVRARRDPERCVGLFPIPVDADAAVGRYPPDRARAPLLGAPLVAIEADEPEGAVCSGRDGPRRPDLDVASIAVGADSSATGDPPDRGSVCEPERAVASE